MRKFTGFDEEFQLQTFQNRDALNEHLKAKDEIVLRDEALYAEPSSSADMRMASHAAQVELDRRATLQAENLAKKTTWIAATVGAVSAIVGAVVGAIIQARIGG